MGAFSGEEKLDLLFKKVAGGVTKTGRSDTTGLDGESISSFTAVAPTHVWKEATATNLPGTPPTSNTAYVGVYEVGGSGSVGTTGQVVAPVTCSAVGSSAHMPGFTNFKRAWDTGLENWIGPAFGSNYKVRVYVGASGWDGTEGGKTTSSIVEVEFGQNPNADWNFDYEAGILYWTNEEDTGETSSFEDSVDFVNSGSVIANNDIVYVTGYRYIGQTGVGGDGAVTATSTVEGLIELFSDTVQTVAANSVSATASRTYGLQLNSDGQAVVNVPWSDTNTTYSAATSTTLGLIELGSDTVQTVAANSVSATASRTYALQVNSDGQGVVNVPWSDTNTTYSAATSTTLGLIELGSDTVQTVAANSVSATASRSYSLQVNSDGQGVVNVPWTDTNTTYSAATSTTLGLIELGSDTVQTVAANSVSATASRSYALQVNSDGQGVVNVPWSDTNTTYSAATSTTLGLIELGSDTVQTVAANSVSATASRSYALQVNSDGQGVVNVPWTDTESFTSVSVTEGANTTAHKVVLTTAAAAGTLTGVQIDTNDLTYTPSSTADRGKLTTGDLLVKGDLTVIGNGSVINLQQENVYIRDAIITLGNADAGDDTDYTDATELAVDIGIEAFKKGYTTTDAAKYPKVVFDHSASVWAVNNWSHAASTENKIAEKFTATVTAAATNVITHNLNTRDVIVQCRVASTEELVVVKYVCNSDLQTTIYFGTGTQGTSVDVVIIG